MPLDGAMLSQIRTELTQAVGCRVDKIYQPSREEIILTLRSRDANFKLLVSAGANSPRVHFTEVSVENPKSPPMFCMLLRKHLNAARLVDFRQVGLARVLHIDFQAVNELGDLVTITMCVEIMGRHSNIIFVDEEGRVLDAIKRIDDEMSSVRPVLPGMAYTLPPPQPDKLSLLEDDVDAILEKLCDANKDITIAKRLMECLQGVSPLLCREIAFFSDRGADVSVRELDEDQKTRLRFYLNTLKENMQGGTCTPTMLLEPGGKPKDFSLVPIRQYGTSMFTREYESYSQLLDAFYSERDAIERMRQRSNDLLKFLVNTSDRIARRVSTQKEELLESANREQLKIYGDLLSTNVYSIQKGDASATVQNYYDETLPDVTIQLDPLLTPVQNVQKYYHEYRKADTAEKKLRLLIEEGEKELVYIDSVFDALTRARLEGELEAIRRELAEQGYLKHYVLRNKKPEKLAPLKFQSSDGFVIYVGRNNHQNDQLTLKDSQSSDIWLHTQKIPGAHTVIVSANREVPNRTLEEAAILAATHSKARESAKVPVDYTKIRYVKKPGGAKPGMVIYDNFQTAIVDPDPELAAKLQIK